MIQFLRWWLTVFNFIFQKDKNQVILIPYPNAESGSINVANYIVQKTDKRVFFVVEREELLIPTKLLDKRVRILIKRHRLDYRYLWKVYRSKFVFVTHGAILNYFPKSQIVINLWHGLLYKKVGRLLGKAGFPATYTVGTSDLTIPMLSKAFGVSEETVLKTGYPRNDSLIRGQRNKQYVIQKLGLKRSFDKILVWMPTYRKSVKGDIRTDGVDVGNPFYIRDFDVIQFNEILRRNNTFCIVKPHPMAPKYDTDIKLSNLIFVDNQWVYNRGLDLYEFIGATDMLISDISSVTIDYLLTDKPILCVSEDFEEYRNSRGFYFDDIEDKLPCVVLKNQFDFFLALTSFLENGVDYNIERRNKLKGIFFESYSDKSTERLIYSVLE